MTTHRPPRLLAIIAATVLTSAPLWAANADDPPVTINASQRAFISRLQPVVGNGAALFDPEISVVTSGVLNDVQATVSADRKYVTMTMRPTNSQLIALREFSFQTASLPAGVNGGLVGGAGGGANANVNANAGGGTGNDNNNVAPAPARNARGRAARDGNKAAAQRAPAPQTPAGPSVLDRPGMVRVANLAKG